MSLTIKQAENGLQLRSGLDGLSWTIMDCQGLSWTAKDYHGLEDCQGLSWTIMDCHELSWTVIDCHGLSRILQFVDYWTDGH